METDPDSSVAPVIRRRLDVIAALLALDSAVLLLSAAAFFELTGKLGFVVLLLFLGLLLVAVLMGFSAMG